MGNPTPWLEVMDQAHPRFTSHLVRMKGHRGRSMGVTWFSNEADSFVSDNFSYSFPSYPNRRDETEKLSEERY